MKILFTTFAAVSAILLCGCGARVSTATGPNGTVLNSANVFSGSAMTLNTQTGLLCIDAAGAGTCKAQEAQQ